MARSDVKVRIRELLATRWEVRYRGSVLATAYAKADAMRWLRIVREYRAPDEPRESYQAFRIARYRLR